MLGLAQRLVPTYRTMSTVASNIKQAKSKLRSDLKHVLKQISNEERAKQSSNILEKITSSDVYKNSQRISIFLPMKDEVNTLPIMHQMLGDGKSCFIPHYEGPDMIMVPLDSWEHYESLPVNSWGIKQPTEFLPSQDALCNGGLDLIFMPGLAFTEEGARLGRGKGYYDKYLSKCAECGKRPHTVALIFQEQLVKNIPVTDQDMFVDTVVTGSVGLSSPGQ